MLLGNSDVLTGAPGARAAGHNPMESPDVPSGVVPPGRSRVSAAPLVIGPVPLPREPTMGGPDPCRANRSRSDRGRGRRSRSGPPDGSSGEPRQTNPTSIFPNEPDGVVNLPGLLLGGAWRRATPPKAMTSGE